MMTLADFLTEMCLLFDIADRLAGFIPAAKWCLLIFFLFLLSRENPSLLKRLQSVPTCSTGLLHWPVSQLKPPAAPTCKPTFSHLELCKLYSLSLVFLYIFASEKTNFWNNLKC